MTKTSPTCSVRPSDWITYRSECGYMSAQVVSEKIDGCYTITSGEKIYESAVLFAGTLDDCRKLETRLTAVSQKYLTECKALNLRHENREQAALAAARQQQKESML